VRPRSRSSRPGPARAGLQSTPGADWLPFDLHGAVRMRVRADAPGAAQLAEMFAAFRCDDVAVADLTVDPSFEELDGAVHAGDGDRYTDEALHLAAARVQVVLDGVGFRVHGSGELLTTVLPLVDRVAVRRGIAMVHAAAVQRDGRGLLLAGTGGAGKTSTVARLVGSGEMRLMGDDWAFAAAGGRLLGFAKPLLLRPHHRDLYPHLFSVRSRRKPLIPPALGAPMGRLATAVHPTLVRYPQAARVLRRWSPEHLSVTPQEAFPEAEVADEAQLAAALYIERAERDDIVADSMDPEWMASRLLGNFHDELPRHSRALLERMCATGLDELHELFGEKQRVLADALQDATCLRLRVPARLLAGEASEVLSAHVRAAIATEVPA
jgi:hypothetical protein